MKKAGIAALLIISLLSLSIVFSAIVLAQESLEKIGQIPQQIEEKKQQISSQWEYLGKEWKNILLKNKLVSAIDSFFTKISIVFTILFGQPYSLSLFLFVIIVIWFVFLYNFIIFFKYYSSFSEPVSYILALLLTIIIAQLKTFEKITNGLFWLAFGEKPWFFSVLIWLIIITVIVLITYINQKFGKEIKMMKKAQKELEEKLEIEKGAAAGKALTKAVEEAKKK